MSIIRVVVRGVTSDYNAFADIARHACAFVEDNESGALAYECFASQDTGQILWHEMYADADAFLAHVDNFVTSGIMEETMRIVNMDPPTIVTRIRDPRVRETAAQFGATELGGLAGYVREGV